MKSIDLSPAAPPGAALLDFEPEPDDFRAEVLHGLEQAPKTLPCKFFYDECGSYLFDQICELEEYYPTRTEMAIMCEHVQAMCALLGRDCTLIEYGSGSSLKTRVLLDHLEAPAAYVPIDISREHLARSAASLRAAYPHVPILPVCADYTRPFQLPPIPSSDDSIGRRIVYFPGSTIGNFHPAQAREFLRAIADTCGPGGGALIGVDLEKSRAILEPAYNDRKGVTAEFNLNLLHRINRELDADFDVASFRHHAFYNAECHRIEMHLESRRDQAARIGDVTIAFQKGESILTECSYKYTPAAFTALAASAGLQVRHLWVDENQLFSVFYLAVA